MAEQDPFPDFDTRFPLNESPLISPPDPFAEIRPMSGDGFPHGGDGGGEGFTFGPQQFEGWEEVQLKGKIKYELDGETDFEDDRTGWVLWRRLGGDSSSSSSESSESSSSESSESSSSSSSSSSESDSGSAKDSCIVPVGWGTGFTALYCVESKDVIFIEIKSLELHGRRSKFKLDPKFMEVCLEDSVKAYGITGVDGLAWGRVEEDFLVIKTPWVLNRATSVNVLLVGMRRDCPQNPWPKLTREQFEANEARIKAFMPREE